MKTWLFCLSLLFCCAEAFATSIWTNSLGGLWSDGTNWLGGAPTNSADTRITNATSKLVIIDATTPSTNLSLGRFQLWGSTTTTNTLLLTDAGLENPLTSSSITMLRGGTLFATNSAIVGTGSLVMSNATVALTNSEVVLSTGSASFTMGGGGSMRLNGSRLVLNGLSQFFNIYGGTLTLDSGLLRLNDSNSVARIGRSTNGNLVINGGTAQIACDLTLGESLARSIGSIRMSGGSLTLGSLVTMAENIGCTGIVSMTGGQLVATNGTNGLLRVGNIGVGQMLLSNAVVKATSLSLADGQAPPGSFSTGIVSVANSQLLIAENPILDPTFTNIVSIGRYGFGQMTVSNGGTVWLPNTSIARHDKAVGILNVLSNGFVGFTDDASIGRFSGATGIVNVVGGQLVNSNSPIWVGRDGNGQLNITNGSVQGPSLFVAMVPTNTARGTLNFNGGTVLLSSNLVLGDASLSTGKVVMASGSLIISNSTTPALLWIASGSFAFNGGEITADNFVMTNAGASFNFSQGVLHTKSTTISNGVAFVVGDGTNSATLDLLAGTHLFADGLVISSNATLTGCGTVVGSIVNHGTILNSNCVVGTRISNVNFASGTFSASFSSQNGLNYTLEFKEHLTDPMWQPLESKPGNGSLLQLMDTNALAPTRFYRILVQ